MEITCTQLIVSGNCCSVILYVVLDSPKHVKFCFATLINAFMCCFFSIAALLQYIVKCYIAILRVYITDEQNSSELENIYDTTCLQGDRRLRNLMTKQLENVNFLVERYVARHNLLSSIESQMTAGPLVLNDNLKCQDIQFCNKSFFMCNGSFGKRTATVVTADAKISDILSQTPGKAELFGALMGSHDMLYNSVGILSKLPEHEHVINIFAYQITRLPRYLICAGMMQISLSDELFRETHISGNVSTLPKLLKIAKQAVSSIQHCHNHDIILRNICSTMFFLIGDEIKLADASYAIDKNRSNGSKNIIYICKENFYTTLVFQIFSFAISLYFNVFFIILFQMTFPTGCPYPVWHQSL